MNIKTYSKAEIEQGVGNGDYLISILSTVETPLSESVKSKYKKVLELRFDDITKEYDGLTLFGEEHLKKIIEFVNPILGESLDIHCSAGISRSTAVALGIADVYYYDSVIFDMLNNKCINPNKHILELFAGGSDMWDIYVDTFGYNDTPKVIEEISLSDLDRE